MDAARGKGRGRGKGRNAMDMAAVRAHRKPAASRQTLDMVAAEASICGTRPIRHLMPEGDLATLSGGADPLDSSRLLVEHTQQLLSKLWQANPSSDGVYNLSLLVDRFFGAGQKPLGRDRPSLAGDVGIPRSSLDAKLQRCAGVAWTMDRVLRKLLIDTLMRAQVRGLLVVTDIIANLAYDEASMTTRQPASSSFSRQGSQIVRERALLPLLLGDRGHSAPSGAVTTKLLQVREEWAVLVMVKASNSEGHEVSNYFCFGGRTACHTQALRDTKGPTMLQALKLASGSCPADARAKFRTRAVCKDQHPSNVVRQSQW